MWSNLGYLELCIIYITLINCYVILHRSIVYTTQTLHLCAALSCIYKDRTWCGVELYIHASHNIYIWKLYIQCAPIYFRVAALFCRQRRRKSVYSNHQMWRKQMIYRNYNCITQNNEYYVRLKSGLVKWFDNYVDAVKFVHNNKFNVLN